MSRVLSPLRQICQRRAIAKGSKRASKQTKKDLRPEEVAFGADPESTKQLGDLLCDQALAQDAMSKLPPKHQVALASLAKQSIRSGIDYATLGLGWDHPQCRTAYQKAEGQSFANIASRRRQAKSRKGVANLSAAIASAVNDTEREALLVAAFCTEISFPVDDLSRTSFDAVAAALGAELLLPLRALREGLSDMTRTFSGMPVPRAPLQQTVDAVTASVLEGRFSEWRYGNPVGKSQLHGLSDGQVQLWREPTASKHGRLTLHEDAPGELGLFWATKIGGPSHGFDFGGQCLLPLLCNARHKVLLLSDTANWPHPCGRAHLRLLWVAGAEPPKPLLWLEALNVDFAAQKSGINTEGWQEAALRHLIDKANAMGVAASVDPRLGSFLAHLVNNSDGARRSRVGKVVEVRERLVLRPSNGVVEASDYLSSKHDWVQMEEEITEPLHRVVYEPPPRLGATKI